MQIQYKNSVYNVKNGKNLLDFIFSINKNIEQSHFCKKGQCKKCYSMVMNTGAYSTREVLACQTEIYSSIRIVALPKILSKN